MKEGVEGRKMGRVDEKEKGRDRKRVGNTI